MQLSPPTKVGSMSTRNLLLAHGTSSAILPDLMAQGLVPNPPRKLSQELIEASGERDHMASLPGAYLASQIYTATSYAKSAAERFGGEPMILLVSVPHDQFVPDEDEVHCQLRRVLIDAFAPDTGEDLQAIPFSVDSILANARDLVLDLFCRFDHQPDEAQIEAVGKPLKEMLLATLFRADGMTAEMVFNDNEGGWATPSWVHALTRDQAGLGIYQSGMDALCRGMAGVDPDAYPCGWESCRGRLPEGVPPPDQALEERPVIVAIGTPEDLFAHDIWRDRLEGLEILDPELEGRLQGKLELRMR